MTTASRVRRLFPGTNTPQGYYSYHRYVMPPEGANRVFLLKGGPGVGKSTLMKRLGKEAEARGLDVEITTARPIPPRWTRSWSPPAASR